MSGGERLLRNRKQGRSPKLNTTILITGVAGFIGSALAKALTDEGGFRIVGIDNLNDYYDVSLKKLRLRNITEPGFEFLQGDLTDRAFLENVFSRYDPEIVVNLAAQAGVRYSIDHPETYIRSNIVGFSNMLEMCRHHGIEHFIFASSSSVYGDSMEGPFSETDRTDSPVSLYAATKKCDEVLAYSYARMFGIRTTGLRFFTVYGPYGRPDMAYFSFSEKLISGQKIRLFNYGQSSRDFTYIDDIVEGIRKIILSRNPDPAENSVPYELFNIGKGDPDGLLDFVTILKEELTAAGLLPEDYDLNAHIILEPMQNGDVHTTHADITKLEQRFGYHPTTHLREGLRNFCRWFAEYKKTETD